MGFDLYGVDQKTVGTPPTRPTTKDYESEEWKNYFADQEFYERLNPGVYFRSNVWYWRPIVIFMQHLGASEDLINKLSYNSGDLVSKEEISEFVDLFYTMLEDGSLDHFILDYKAEVDSLPKEECHCCDGTGKLKTQPMFNTDPDWDGTCHVCKGSGEVENFRKNYPMDKDILVEFFEFAKLSGGFTVH